MTGQIHVTRGHKNPKLILNNNEFFYHKKCKDKSRWRCTAYYKTKCKAALYTYGRILAAVMNVYFSTLMHYITRLDIIFVAPGTKNPKLIIDNNIFTVNTKSAEATRWRCTSYFKCKCRATLLTCGNVVRMNREHNHPPVLKSSHVAGSQPQRVIHFLQGRSYKNPLILLNGDEFFLHQRRSNSTRWRCRAYHKTKCRSALCTFGKIVKIYNNHNHYPFAMHHNTLNLIGQNFVIALAPPIFSYCADPPSVRVIFIAKANKNPKLILDDNEYVTHVITKDKTRWRCKSYFKTKCMAALVTRGKVVRMVHEHNHPPNIKNMDSKNLLIKNVHIYPKIILENNEYQIYQKDHGRTRWRCAQYFKTKCKSRLVSYGRVVKINHIHNHLPFVTNLRDLQFSSQVVKFIRNPYP
ncbi:FLYWCH domain containing protein [Asbolus verrucosus]|uniref:FLYWCH domain containing protein n=1 Tax=Asbolus verrucosus TaxID=1661398 RepID=A0A482W3C9_ASBVE|nr:FLYWCH domain containing protein [Asbolus verrucosus]